MTSPAARRDRKSHLRERDAELRHPAFVVLLGTHFPHAVVVAIEANVVEVLEVALHAGRVGLIDVGRKVIMLGIEAHLDSVGGRAGITAAQTRRDPRWFPVVAPHRHVEVAVVIGDLDDRPLAERHHVVGLPLDEIVDVVGDPPHLIVEAAIDARRVSGDAKRAQDLVHFGFCGWLDGFRRRRRSVLGTSQARDDGQPQGNRPKQFNLPHAQTAR